MLQYLFVHKYIIYDTRSLYFIITCTLFIIPTLFTCAYIEILRKLFHSSPPLPSCPQQTGGITTGAPTEKIILSLALGNVVSIFTALLARVSASLSPKTPATE